MVTNLMLLLYFGKILLNQTQTPSIHHNLSSRSNKPLQLFLFVDFFGYFLKNLSSIMQFRNSSSEINTLLSQTLCSTFSQVDRRHLLSFFHKYQASLTIRRQLLLLKHGNPRHDNHQSRFRILNMWRQDQQPIPLNHDSMNPFSVPSAEPEGMGPEEGIEDGLSVAESDLSILRDIGKQQHKSKYSQEQVNVELGTQKSVKKIQKTNRSDWKHNHSKKHLVALTKDEENQPEEIAALRSIKLKQEIEKQRVSTEATSKVDHKVYRLDTSRQKSKSKSGPKKRPQTSNVYLLRTVNQKPQGARIMTATVRK